jgi:flagellin-specific chaperone FliS
MESIEATKKMFDSFIKKMEKKENLIKNINEISDELNIKKEINFNDIEDPLEREEKELTEKLYDIKRRRQIQQQKEDLINKVKSLKEDIKEQWEDIKIHFYYLETN